jgi:hypothetical protein
MTLPPKMSAAPEVTMTARGWARGDILRKSALLQKPTNHRSAAK